MDMESLPVLTPYVGAAKALGYQIADEIALRQLIQRGIPSSDIKKVKDLGVDEQDIFAKLAHSESGTLTPGDTLRLLQLAADVQK